MINLVRKSILALPMLFLSVAYENNGYLQHLVIP